MPPATSTRPSRSRVTAAAPRASGIDAAGDQLSPAGS
jgi:hypothetical protein